MNKTAVLKELGMTSKAFDALADSSLKDKWLILIEKWNGQEEESTSTEEEQLPL